MDVTDAPINLDIPVRKSFTFGALHAHNYAGTRLHQRSHHASKYTKPSKEDLDKYFIRKWSTTANIFSRDMFLAYRMFTKAQHAERNRMMRKLPLLQQHRRAQTALRLRLHMAAPQEHVHAITDVDKHFFTLLEMTPRGGNVAEYKSLKVQCSQYLLLRIETAFSIDCILNVDSNMRREGNILNKAFEDHKSVCRSFNSFVAEDYKKSVGFMKRCLDSERKLMDTAYEMHQLAEQLSHLNAELVVLDYKLRLQQKYGRFLYYLSPSTWRAHHREFARSVDIVLRGFDLGTSGGFDTVAELCSAMHNEFKDGNLKAELYFSEPEDLLDVFDNVAKRHLHYFLYVTEVFNLTTSCKRQVEALKHHIQVESHDLTKCLQEYEMLLQFEKTKVQLREKEFYRILKGVFQETVCSKDVLKLFVHLDYCSEFILGYQPSSFGVSIKGMAKHLEGFFMEYSSLLEQETNGEVKKAMAEYVRSQETTMMNAEKARREMRCLKRLRENLRRAFEPPQPRPKLPIAQLVQTRAVTRRRDAPLPMFLKQQRPKERALTQDEQDYLMFFTEWVRGEDPMLYLKDKCLDVF